MINWPALQTRTNAAVMAVFGAAVVIDGDVVQGDFHAPADEVFLDGVSAMASKPQVVLCDADVPAAPVGKPCTAGGASWIVADARPDGHGMTTLFLERAL